MSFIQNEIPDKRKSDRYMSLAVRHLISTCCDSGSRHQHLHTLIRRIACGWIVSAHLLTATLRNIVVDGLSCVCLQASAGKEKWDWQIKQLIQYEAAFSFSAFFVSPPPLLIFPFNPNYLCHGPVLSQGKVALWKTSKTTHIQEKRKKKKPWTSLMK